MAINVFRRNGSRLPNRRTAVLLGVGLAILLTVSISALALIQRPGGPLAPVSSPVEVIYSQPLRVNHAMPNGQVSGQANTAGQSTNSASPDSGLAAAALSADFFDFGSIASRAVVRHDFLVINRGSAPLEIRRAYTTCGCTSADLSTTRIPPGKAAQVTVIFDAGFHPVAGQTVRRGLILETNDPERPQLEIWVQAAVR